jgi:2-C-methyl-D-erythritol 2,4-cyclodiphosphate synthase
VAELLGVKPDQIGIKAKTPEGMGTDNAAIAHVAVLLERAGKPRSLPTKGSRAKKSKTLQRGGRE